jgi:hypothetical protein
MLKIPGIRKARGGFRVYCKVGRQQRERRFPLETSRRTMQDWRAEARRAMQTHAVRPLLPPGSL